MMRLAHELAQNGAEAITFFSTMVPDQALSNSDTLSYSDPPLLMPYLSTRGPDDETHPLGTRHASRPDRSME